MWLCVGVVFGDHNTEFAPGDKRTASIGFDARTGRIYDADTKYSNGKKATGNGRSVLSFLVLSNNGGVSISASMRCTRAGGKSRGINIGIRHGYKHKPKHIKTMRCSVAYAYVFTSKNAEHKCKTCSQSLNGLSIPDLLLGEKYGGPDNSG